MARLSWELARALVDHPNLDAAISISSENANFADFEALRVPIVPIHTFSSDLGAIGNIWRLPAIRKTLKRWIGEHGTRCVIDLMPHVWSPFIAPAIKACGAGYVAIVHDADRHPGDPTALVKRWTDQALDHADGVLTLSEAVAARLEAQGRVPRKKMAVLFHPDLTYGRWIARELPSGNGPFRLLFMGRLLAYKGLPLFLDAVQILREKGLNIEVGVFGEGALGPSAPRLQAVGAEVVDRWLTDTEIGAVLARFHVMVLSHTEASQSGVAAAALGSGLPVVATPVGGLVEQIADRRTGLLARRADATALADALEELLRHPALYRSICENILLTRDERSMGRFVDACASHALRMAARDGRDASPAL